MTNNHADSGALERDENGEIGLMRDRVSDTSQVGTASSPLSNGTDETSPSDGDPTAQARERHVGETLGGQAPDGLQKDPSEWVTGDDPMTDAQRSYLDTLARQAGEELPANLTKAEASEQIDRLQAQQGTQDQPRR